MVEADFEVSYVFKSCPVCQSPSAATDQDVKLSARSPALCLPEYCHASQRDDNGLDL